MGSEGEEGFDVPADLFYFVGNEIKKIQGRIVSFRKNDRGEVYKKIEHDDGELIVKKYDQRDGWVASSEGFLGELLEIRGPGI